MGTPWVNSTSPQATPRNDLAFRAVSSKSAPHHGFEPCLASNRRIVCGVGWLISSRVAHQPHPPLKCVVAERSRGPPLTWCYRTVLIIEWLVLRALEYLVLVLISSLLSSARRPARAWYVCRGLKKLETSGDSTVCMVVAGSSLES